MVLASILGLFVDFIANFFSPLVDLANNIFVIAGGTIAALFFGVYGLFSRFGLALLTGLTRSAGTGIGDRFVIRGAGASGQLAGRRLPSAIRQRHARQALWNADARLARLERYVEVWLGLLAARAGPFAVSMHLMSLLHRGFQEKTARLARRAQKFDRLEEKAQSLLQRYEADYAIQCEPLRDSMLRNYVELSLWKARGRRFAWQVWRRRWRYTKRRQVLVRRRIIAERLELHKAEQRLNKLYRIQLEPALTALDLYESTYLAHWVHSFEADLESFRLTVVTGRLIAMLKEPQNARLAETLGLASLPDTTASLTALFTTFLAERQAVLGPNEGIETLFEAYLRLRLIEEPELCRRWGIERQWIERMLPAPGSLGLAHEYYGHLTDAGVWRREARVGGRNP